jgi:hypothetical protein
MAKTFAIQNFLQQAEACEQLGSPFNARLCRLLASTIDRTSSFGARLLDWPDRAEADAVALRACGALHALARSGRQPSLSAAYPPDRSIALEDILADAIAAEDAFLTSYLDSPPQTNEVARSAIILGGLLTIAATSANRLELIELGSSAGLNLLLDQYHYRLGEEREWGAREAPVSIVSRWTGNVPDVTLALNIARRAGCDRNPLDPSLVQTRQRLLSYVWPDQTDRMARLEAALGNAMKSPMRVINEDAAVFAERQLTLPQEAGTVRVLMHTIVWQYLTEPTQNRIGAAMRTAAARADAQRPLAWLSVEADGQPKGANISLRLWPENQRRSLGRADFHGRWVEWA